MSSLGTGMANHDNPIPAPRLRGMRALVVGGGSGIGRAVVAAYVQEGARVGVMELDAAKCAELDRLPGVAWAIPGNSSSVADCAVALERCRQTFGGLDVLVNCAGIFDFYRPLSDIPSADLEAAFAEIFQNNVLSQLAASRLALDLLRESRGSIILTGSSSSFYAGRGGILYVASKFAVRGCVLALAHELAPDIRVNGVAPGGVLGTDLRGSERLGQGERRLAADAARVDDLKQLSPLRLAMSTDDVARSYVFLASPDAVGMTGQLLQPDGGLGVRG